MSVVSTGCVLWLQRAQPMLAAIALLALGYQGWLVWRRPRARRTRAMLAIVWASAGTTAVVFLAMTLLWLRYW